MGKKIRAIFLRLFKLIGFFLFSLGAGIGLGYLILLYLNFDVVHRKGTSSSKVVHTDIAPLYKLPIESDNTIQNIILFIGDGMGLNQITATRYRYYGPEGRLNIERMPVTGVVSTFAANGALITDSGAGGTALATGYKTDIGMVGMTPSGESRMSILEALQSKSWATGLVTTSDISDATPGAFASHVASRKKKLEIVKQLIEHKVNLLVSGGETFHGQELEGDERVSVIEYAQRNGYSVVNDKQEFFGSGDSLLLGLFEGMASDKLGNPIVFNEKAPTLEESTQKAISLLSRQEDHFFLMVEEEGVDSGSHINRIDYMTRHLKNLDDAVAVALDFAERDQHTLVLVMADHETGGLTLVNDNSDEDEIGVRWSTDGHTGQPIPLFAYGHHAMAFTGVWDNTDIARVIAQLLKLKDFPEE